MLTLCLSTVIPLSGVIVIVWLNAFVPLLVTLTERLSFTLTSAGFESSTLMFTKSAVGVALRSST